MIFRSFRSKLPESPRTLELSGSFEDFASANFVAPAARSIADLAYRERLNFKGLGRSHNNRSVLDIIAAPCEASEANHIIFVKEVDDVDDGLGNITAQGDVAGN